MLSVIELVLPLFALIFLGYLSGRMVRIPAEGLAWMNFFIIYIALPAMFFQLLSKTPVEQFSQFGFISAAVLATFLIFCAGIGIAFWRNSSLPEATVQGLSAAYGNIGYLGPPLALTAFGPAAGVPVALIFCFENAMHFTLAPLLMAVNENGGQSKVALFGQILKKIFSHPFILATIAGVLASFLAVEPPQLIDSFLDLLARTAAPCALFAMGVTAALRPLKRIPIELGYLVPLKLIVHPFLVYFLLIWLVPDVQPVWLYSAVLLATLPTATNVFVIAQQYDVWKERASSAVVISTLFSMLSVTGFLYLARSGWLMN